MFGFDIWWMFGVVGDLFGICLVDVWGCLGFVWWLFDVFELWGKFSV